ncbi:transmembrane and coiled-coil domain-containing protein 6 isoform X2 [Bombina bombina]|uniref:transmembrane and coiled-coil domain-containing protein 6 isoform X2 n=1 Tax=Bombina bombina TaxID=8345 RepID=UPI00235B1AFB|nr:transmembrane and coiled-coil domain-containing protein 6 isoform X2 [Bombina bombina]
MWRKNNPKHKSLLGLEELRAHRRERETALRKARREQQLISKRLLRDLTEDHDQTLEEGLETQTLSEQQVVQMIKDLQHGSANKLKSLVALWHRLQQKNVQLIFIKVEGSLRLLIGLFTSSFADIQMEAARCLHELSHSDEPEVTKACLPATPYLITYLSGHSPEFTELCLYTLGNLIVESEDARNQLLQQGLISALTLCAQSPHMRVLEAFGYALSQLLQAKEAPEKIIPMVLGSGLTLDILRLILFGSQNGIGVAVELAWCLHYIVSSQVNNNVLISQDIVQKLVIFLIETAAHISKNEYHGLELMICPIVRSLGNLLAVVNTAGSNSKIQDGRLLVALFVFMQIFKNDYVFIVRECLWTLNNLTVENPVISSAVLHLNLIPVLLELLTHSNAVTLLVLLVLCNIANLGIAYCQQLRQKGILPSIVRTFVSADAEVAHQCLELLNILFRHCPEVIQKKLWIVCTKKLFNVI